MNKGQTIHWTTGRDGTSAQGVAQRSRGGKVGVDLRPRGIATVRSRRLDALDRRRLERRMSIRLVVSVHDVAPATVGQSARLTQALADTGVPLTQLVIPGPWRGDQFGASRDGERLAAWLRDRQDCGDEVSLHGWLHRADVPGSAPRRLVGSVVARGAGELWALDRATTASRARAGLDALTREGLAVTGCTPPGWLACRAARAGLADVGLQYVTDHAGLVDLGTGRRWVAPALCQRPAPAIGPGAAAAGVGLERLGRRTVALARRLVAAGRSVRLALHPGDLDRPGLVEDTVRAVHDCLRAGAVPTTYAQILQTLRAPR